MSDAPEGPEILPPELAARFETIRALGEGMCGRVVLARDRELGRDVAIKLLFSRWAGKQDSSERFRREAEYMGRVRSPRVAEVFDHGMAGAQPYMVTRFVDGPDLKAYLGQAGGTLPMERSLEVLRQILEGLVAIHGADVIHRDLKPANVMLTRQGDVVITDFGLGRAIGDETLTRTGALVGTPAFMTPEQMQGVRAGKDADVYAAVMIWLNLLTGRIPLIGHDIPSTLARRSVDLGWTLNEKGFDVPRPVDELVALALSPDARRRPPDALAFTAAFEAAWRGEPLPPWSPPEGADADPRPGQATTPGADTTAVPAAGLQLSGPPGAGSTGRFVALSLLGLVLLAGALFRLLRPPVAGPAPAGPVEVIDDPGEDASRRDPRTALAELRRALDGDPAIEETLGLTMELDKRQALQTWESGRVSFRRLAREHDLHGLARDLVDADLAIADVNHLSRVLLIERLLSTTEHEGVPPLFEDGQDTGLGEAMARVVRCRREPALSGSPVGKSEERREHYLAGLTAGGRRWATLRDFPSLRRVFRDKEFFNTWVFIQNPAGDRFRDPTEGTPELVIASVNRTFDRDRYAVTEDHVTLEPVPPEAGRDLFLATPTYGFTIHDHVWMELIGRDETLQVTARPPPYLGPRTGSDGHSIRVGMGLQVKARWIPRGLRKVRLRFFALQSIGRVLAITHLEEVYQLVKGPPPEVFDG